MFPLSASRAPTKAEIALVRARTRFLDNIAEYCQPDRGENASLTRAFWKRKKCKCPVCIFTLCKLLPTSAEKVA